MAENGHQPSDEDYSIKLNHLNRDTLDTLHRPDLVIQEDKTKAPHKRCIRLSPSIVLSAHVD